MGFREIEKPAITSDSFGTAEVTRFFRAWNVTPTQVVSAPTTVLRGENTDGLPSNDPLPEYKSQFEGMAGVELVSYQVQGNGIVVDIQAKYASGGITIFPPPNLDTAWVGSFQTEQFVIPFAVLKRSYVPGVPDPSAPPNTPVPRVEVDDWAFDEQPIFQTVVRHQRKARIETNLATAIDIIAEQNNKLHKIGSRWYRFEAGDYKPYDATKYEFSYSFVYDSGTQAVTTSTTNPQASSLYIMPTNSFRHPIQQIYPLRTFTRPPFCNIFAVRGPGSPSGPESGQAEPEFVAFCNYDMSVGAGGQPGLGWLQLPGILQ